MCKSSLYDFNLPCLFLTDLAMTLSNKGVPEAISENKNSLAPNADPISSGHIKLVTCMQIDFSFGKNFLVGQCLEGGQS